MITSYPAAGDPGLSIEQWELLYAHADGIVRDYSGNAGSITRNAAANQITLSPVRVSVNGYVLDVADPEVIDVPVPTTTTSYGLYAVYDPALNVELPDGSADPLGPVRLVRTTGTPDLSGDKAAVVLHDWTRAAGQSLDDITIFDRRRWIGGVFHTGIMPPGEMASPRVSLPGWGPFSRGTRMTVKGGSTYVLEPEGGEPPGPMRWVDVNAGVTTELVPASGFTAAVEAPYFRRSNGGTWVSLTGTIKRSSGAAIVTAAASQDVVIANLPVGVRPGRIKRFVVYETGKDLAVLKVESNGNISVYAQGRDVMWVDLAPVMFETGF